MAISSFAKYDSLVEESSKDPKLAMRDCERRRKKQPNDPAIKLFKIYLLLKQRLYEQAHQHCIDISNAPEIANDFRLVGELLDLDQRCVRGLGQESDVTLTTNLAKRKDTLPSVFGTLLGLGYWEAAESAAISLQKLNMKDKNRQHVRCLMSQLYASSQSKVNPAVSTMRERLVKAMLSKAVGNSMLSTTQDLRFCLQLYMLQEDFQTAIDLLDNKELGLFSALGNADIEFIRLKLICLKRLQKWREVYDFCARIVDAYGEADNVLRQWTFDWTVWNGLAESLVVLQRTGGDFSFEKFVRERLPQLDLSSPESRTMWIAHIKYASSLHQDVEKSSNALSNVCISYLENHFMQRYCYTDLRQFVAQLDQTHIQQLLDKAHALSETESSNHKRSTVPELNALKLDFWLSISAVTSPDQQHVSRHITITLRFIRLLQALDEKNELVLEEAYLLAVAGLEKLAGLLQSRASVSKLRLQAVCMLEHALLKRNAPNSFRARIALITLYRRLGLVSLSMHQYQTLRLREIQNDTISHLLYHRISMLHPFTLDAIEKRRLELDAVVSNPTLGLQRLIDWYDLAKSRVDGFLSVPVESLRYDKVQEFVDLNDDLRNSLQRQLVSLERRRIARIVDRPYDESDYKIDLLSPVWALGLSDKRDFSEGIDFAMSADSDWAPQDVTNTGAARYYLAMLTELDATQSLLHAKDAGIEHRNSAVRLKHAAAALQSIRPHHSPLYEGESQAQDIVHRLRPLVMAATLGDKPEFTKEFTTPSVKEIENILAAVLSYMSTLRPPAPNESTGDWEMPTESVVAGIFSTMDCLKTISKLTDLLTMSSKQKAHVLYQKIKSETLGSLGKEVLLCTKAVQDAVADWRNSIKNKWRHIYDPLAVVANSIGDEELEAEMLGLVGHRFMLDAMAPKLRDSAMETLDGILNVKVK